MSVSKETSGLEETASNPPNSDKEVWDILNAFNNLRHFTKEMENELKSTENQSYKSYLKESENIASLHVHITDCDQILARMENMFLGLHNGVGNLKSEVLTLQKKSILLNEELTNRQAIREQLIQFLDDFKVPETIIGGLIGHKATSKNFLSQLETLSDKISSMKEQNYTDSYHQNLREVVEKLRVEAVSKIRAYVLDQIAHIQKITTSNLSAQNNLLQYKAQYRFLLYNGKNVAEEIVGTYIETMNKLYYSYFKSYEQKVMKLQSAESFTVDDLLGVKGGKSPRDKTEVFSIGNRGDVLAQLEAPIIDPNNESTKGNILFEHVFRSVQYSLVVNSCREHAFITEYFAIKNVPVLDMFHKIMHKALTLLQNNLDSYISTCYDPITIFLCFHLVLRFKTVCQKYHVRVLDEHWKLLENILLPRLDHIFQLNIKSIKDCDVKKFNFELGPHYLAKRYPEFSAVFVSINEICPNDLVTQLLEVLQKEVEQFFVRMASEFKERKEQVVFLIKNYEMILSILLDKSKDNFEETKKIKSILADRSVEYAEEIVISHFGDLVQYVKECEQCLAQINMKELKALKPKSVEVVQNFNNNWKESLKKLNTEVLLSFPNLVTGKNLVQLTLTQLVQYYYRFYKLTNPSIRSELVGINLIMEEMRKYGSS